MAPEAPARRPISKVLVANRGEIARRVFRTCRRLGLRTVAVYSDADRDAPHVAEADERVRLGPPPARESYLNANALIEALHATRADAVHPGYGFLSEKASFARAVQNAGAIFVGPPPDVLEAFGDKVNARRVAAAAGTVAVPGTDAPVDFASERGIARVKEAARDIGYPVIVKAVGGGGGIGMQVALGEEQLSQALAACESRGSAAFADARVYLEKYVSRPRHIEVQVLCDAHGQAFALGERECSVQRRHQKLIEETPSPARFFALEGGAARRAALHEAALRVVRQVGYVGAGTCEFIADGQGNLYFLEVNARLQVEHPVTELVTGLDLVEQQLRIAAGERLPDLTAAAAPHGHAIEARICAEDPRRGFLPSPGAIDVLVWAGGEGEPQTPELRVESGVRAGERVTPYYDSMIAKVAAWGPTRREAVQRLDAALASTTIAPLVTNLAFLRRVLADAAFERGEYDTSLAEALAKSA